MTDAERAGYRQRLGKLRQRLIELADEQNTRQQKVYVAADIRDAVEREDVLLSAAAAVAELRAALDAAPAQQVGIPDHICGICYHQFDRCSHCDAQYAAYMTGQVTDAAPAAPEEQMMDEQIIEIDEDGKVHALGARAAMDLAELNQSAASPGERGPSVADWIDKIARERAEKAEAEVQRLTAERDDQAKRIAGLEEYGRVAVLNATRAHEEVARLRAALEQARKYVRHTSRCRGYEAQPWRAGDDVLCTCGLAAALTPPAGTEPR